MSFNIYEDPNLSMNVKYSRGVADDRGEREERQVDIYERGSDQQVDVSTQNRGVHVQKHPLIVQRNLFGAAVLLLGLLCLLLLVGLAVLYNLYDSVTTEMHLLSNSYEELKISSKKLNISHEKLKISYENLLNDYCDGGESETQGNIAKWRRFRCSCYYKSTEMKSWTDSRTDCQSRGADLVIINDKAEQDFLKTLNGNGTFWIGVLLEKTDGWTTKWEWKLVDGSRPTYVVWDKDTNPTAVDGSRGYIDQQGGTWRHTNNGSKQWICEKQM